MCLLFRRKKRHCWQTARLVDFSYTPEPHVAFCPIFVDPF